MSHHPAPANHNVRLEATDMATFDFTKFLNSVFNLNATSFRLSSQIHNKHENISCSSADFEQNYGYVSQAFLMLSKTYNFSLSDGDIFHFLGLCRVVSIVINESSYPELLLETQEGKQLGFYSIINLFSPDLSKDNLPGVLSNIVTPLRY